MGRKNRMKSTFPNSLNLGTFWICHHFVYCIVEVPDNDFKYLRIEDEDILIIVDKTKTHVKFHSQKLNKIMMLEYSEFFKSCHKL